MDSFLHERLKEQIPQALRIDSLRATCSALASAVADGTGNIANLSPLELRMTEATDEARQGRGWPPWHH